jgi:hypothetical protein
VVQSERILSDMGQDLALAVSTQESGMIELLAGNVDGAHDEFKRGFDELTRFGDVGYRATNAALLGRTLYELGRVDEAVVHLNVALETKEEDPTVEQDVLPVQAQIAADRGDAAGALDFITRAREAAYATDAMTVQAHVEVQAVKTLRTLQLHDQLEKAQLQARRLCLQKEAAGLLAVADITP